MSEKIFLLSLGCDKNLSDSEHMLGALSGLDYEIVDDEAEAEAIIINTCCFIDSAKEESIQTILEMAYYRREGSCRALIVTARRFWTRSPRLMSLSAPTAGTGSGRRSAWQARANGP